MIKELGLQKAFRTTNNSVPRQPIFLTPGIDEGVPGAGGVAEGLEDVADVLILLERSATLPVLGASNEETHPVFWKIMLNMFPLLVHLNQKWTPTCVVVAEATALSVDVSLVDAQPERGGQLVQHSLVGQPEALHDVLGHVVPQDHTRVCKVQIIVSTEFFLLLIMMSFKIYKDRI